jgi:hypothetical protein
MPEFSNKPFCNRQEIFDPNILRIFRGYSAEEWGDRRTTIVQQVLVQRKARAEDEDASIDKIELALDTIRAKALSFQTREFVQYKYVLDCGKRVGWGNASSFDQLSASRLQREIKTILYSSNHVDCDQVDACRTLLLHLYEKLPSPPDVPTFKDSLFHRGTWLTNIQKEIHGVENKDQAKDKLRIPLFQEENSTITLSTQHNDVYNLLNKYKKEVWCMRTAVLDASPRWREIAKKRKSNQGKSNQGNIDGCAIAHMLQTKIGEYRSLTEIYAKEFFNIITDSDQGDGSHWLRPTVESAMESSGLSLAAIVDQVETEVKQTKQNKYFCLTVKEFSPKIEFPDQFTIFDNPTHLSEVDVCPLLPISKDLEKELSTFFGSLPSKRCKIFKDKNEITFCCGDLYIHLNTNDPLVIYIQCNGGMKCKYNFEYPEIGQPSWRGSTVSIKIDRHTALWKACRIIAGRRVCRTNEERATDTLFGATVEKLRRVTTIDKIAESMGGIFSRQKSTTHDHSISTVFVDTYIGDTVGKLLDFTTHEIHFLATGCNTGKTESIMNVIAHDPSIKTVLCLVPGIALNNNYEHKFNKFGIHDIQSYNNKRSGRKVEFRVDRIHVTPESFIACLLQTKTFPVYDLVVVDEASYSFATLFTSPTMKGKDQCTVDMFEKIITACKRLIVACADMDDHIIGYYRKQRPNTRAILYVSTAKNSGWSNFILHDEHHFWKRMLVDLLDGKCLYCAFDAKESGTRKYLDMIEFIFGEESVITVDKDSPPFLKDLSNIYTEIQKRGNRGIRVVAVIVSPTITVGVDISKRIFDAVYSSSGNKSINPSVKEQQDCRVRKLTIGNENHRYVLIKHKTSSKRHSYDEMKAKFDARTHHGLQVAQREGDVFRWGCPHSDNLLYCHIKQWMTKNNSLYCQLRKALMKRRGDCLFKVTPRVVEKNSTFKTELSHMKKQEFVEKILCAKELSKGEYEAIQYIGGDGCKNYSFEIMQFKLREFLRCSKSDLSLNMVWVFGKDPTKYIKQCYTLCRYMELDEQVSKPKENLFQTIKFHKLSAWDLYHTMSKLIGELFDTDLVIEEGHSVHAFTPRTAGMEITLDSKDELLTDTIRKSESVVDTEAFLKRVFDGMTAAFLHRETVSHKKKEASLTLASMGGFKTQSLVNQFRAIIEELFPAHVVDRADNKMYPLFQKLKACRDQKEKSEKYGYKCCFNKEAVKLICNMVTNHKLRDKGTSEKKKLQVNSIAAEKRKQHKKCDPLFERATLEYQQGINENRALYGMKKRKIQSQLPPSMSCRTVDVVERGNSQEKKKATAAISTTGNKAHVLDGVPMYVAASERWKLYENMLPKLTSSS